MYLAYVLIVFNYNEHPPATQFILNEDLKMFFIRVLKDRAFFFFSFFFSGGENVETIPQWYFSSEGRAK